MLSITTRVNRETELIARAAQAQGASFNEADIWVDARAKELLEERGKAFPECSADEYAEAYALAAAEFGRD
jgi:hypothetical protein